MTLKQIFSTLYAKYFNWLTVLIILNIGTYFCYKFCCDFDTKEFIDEYLSASLNFSVLIQKPWSIISYMFVENDFFPLIYNVLLLSFFGRIFKKILNDKKLLATYVIGGIAGNLFTILICSLFSFYTGLGYCFTKMSSIYAIIVAIITYYPNYKIQFFSKEITIKTIATIFLVITLAIMLFPQVYCLIVDVPAWTKRVKSGQMSIPLLLAFGGMLYGFAWGVYQRILKNKELKCS